MPKLECTSGIQRLNVQEPKGELRIERCQRDNKDQFCVQLRRIPTWAKYKSFLKQVRLKNQDAWSNQICNKQNNARGQTVNQHIEIAAAAREEKETWSETN